MSSVRVCLSWAPLLVISIVLAQIMNSAFIRYLERPQEASTTPVVNTNMPHVDDRLLDATNPAVAMVGSMYVATAPDRAADNRLSTRTTP
jgi:hypothetical protein